MTSSHISRIFLAATLIAFSRFAPACPSGHPEACPDDNCAPIPKDNLHSTQEENWQKYANNPVFLGVEGEWDAGPTCFVVRHFPWGYMMIYSAGGNFGSGFGLATSEDGITWERHPNNPIMVPDSGVVVWGPELLHDGERYHLWYVSSGMDQSGISHATSDDAVHWTQSENNPVIDHGGCHAVIWDGEQYRIFIQHASGRQHGFELQVSADGESWETRGFTFRSGSVGNWDEITAAPSVAYYENQLHLWYTGADTVGNRRGEIAIGHAASDNWGDSFKIPEVRTDLRALRPTEQWEGRGLYSSGIDFDGDSVKVWYAATGANGGFGFASRAVNAVAPRTDDRAVERALWSISPNPAAGGAVKINYLGRLSAPAIVRLYDAGGRMAYQKVFGANEPMRVDPAALGLPVGEYIVQIVVGSKVVHQRLAVVK